MNIYGISKFFLSSVPGWSSPEVVDSAIKAFDTFYFVFLTRRRQLTRRRTLVYSDRQGTLLTRPG